MNMIDIINITQLEILGVGKEHIYYSLLFVSAIVVSMVLHPIISLFIKRRFTYVLIYLVSSLSMFLISMFLSSQIGLDIKIDTLFHIISLYGFSLTCYLLIQATKNKKRRITK